MFRHILLPIDGCELSRRAATAGIALADAAGARVTVFHAADEDSLMSESDEGAYATRPSDSLPEMVEAPWLRCVTCIEDAARSRGVPCDRAVTVGAPPWQAMLKVAQERGCDLIFMAAHGRHGNDALLLGSETSKVLTHATFPVLVYRQA